MQKEWIKAFDGTFIFYCGDYGDFIAKLSLVRIEDEANGIYELSVRPKIGTKFEPVGLFLVSNKDVKIDRDKDVNSIFGCSYNTNNFINKEPLKPGWTIYNPPKEMLEKSEEVLNIMGYFEHLSHWG